MHETVEEFGGQNLAFVEDLYLQFLADPSSVSAEWQSAFEPLRAEQSVGPVRFDHQPRSIFNPLGAPEDNGGGADGGSDKLLLQDQLDQLVQAYRSHGHLESRLDPLDRPRERRPELVPAYYNLQDSDLDSRCSLHSLGSSMTVGQVIRRLHNTYSRYIGVEYTYLQDADARRWLQDRMESTENRMMLGREQQEAILGKLIEAEVFEQFIRKKYLGAKSFSLEGGESLIPLLHLAIEQGAEDGVEEVIIGMAHRGRLSVLANILGKLPREIFREFDDADNEKYWGRGDVKYHLGYRTEQTTRGGKTVRLRLAFNPSHLEFVAPVVLGRVRARQDRLGDRGRSRVMPVVLHGDAAFAGQGVVQETLNMSELTGYRTGGTLHIIVNNQIGFTTDPTSSRSCRYATDVARMLRVPIFHVNGEHPESVAQVVDLAMAFRRQFQKDVFIDLYCYRRHGHNEGDEPSFTQPDMYRRIRERPTVRESYLEHLLETPGVPMAQQAERMIAEQNAHLDEELAAARVKHYKSPQEKKTPGWPWSEYRGGLDADVERAGTAVPDRERLASLLRKSTEVPEGFSLFPKLRRILNQRLEMADGERPLDWSGGETLAFATLLAEGHDVRLSGQDCGRGTFSHRHAVLHDHETEQEYAPLAHMAVEQGRFEVWNSPLSEAAVLGFDYGYSLDRPDSLVIWEAQFGDFANGAQVIIDQFISSAEDKWELLSGLVMLLPHGFEGQGPEHSSARLERFLQLCAEDNMQIVNLTTPAQIFHCLRRQVVRPYRKPLVIMSPKSLLRLPQAISSLEDLMEGGFQRVIPDGSAPGKIRRVLLCSGRVYYDLENYRRDRQENNVDIIRIEQLYPFPEKELRDALEPILEGDKAKDGCEAVWVQEEPQNMGCWYYLRAMFGETLWGQIPFSCVARNESASPATGSPASHRREQEFLVTRAFWSK